MKLYPNELLKEIGRKYPQAWQQIKMFRAAKGKDLPDWPDWCYLPIAAAYAIITADPCNPYLHELRISPAVLTAAATWRVSKGVYRFDADLYNSLVTQPMDDKLPCDSFYRLPEWCVYIETIHATYVGRPVVGFWAHLEYDINTARPELRFVFFHPDSSMSQIPLHLGDWSVDEGLDRMRMEAQKQAERFGINIGVEGFGAHIAPELTPFLQLVLYLCADNVDMPVRPDHPKTKVRMSGQVDVPKDIRIWGVGSRIGAAIRKHRNDMLYNEDSIVSASAPGSSHKSHSRPRPHIRRAHWHHFWTGPRDGDRKLIMKWLPPIPVNIDDDDSGPAVIHIVK